VTLVPAALMPTATPVMVPWTPPLAAILLLQFINVLLQMYTRASRLMHYPFDAAGRARTYNLRDAEADSDGGVGEGHDGGECGEPGHAVQAGDLREGDLHDAVDGNVRGDGAAALALVPFLVEAACPLDRATNTKRCKNGKDLFAEISKR
jgi:hypothetical protein